MTHRDDDPKVPAIATGPARPAAPGATTPSAGHDDDPGAVSVERTSAEVGATSTTAVAADELAPVSPTETLQRTARPDAVGGVDGILPSDGDVAVAAALRSGEVDAQGALERIVDDVIQTRFAGRDSAELRAALLEALAADPLVASLLASE